MLTLITSKHSNLRSSKLLPPSNPATRFQAAAISFSLINLVSRPLYHHWPLLAYLSPRASHFFRFIPFFLFFLSRYRFFFFFFFIPSDQLDLSRISGKITLIHSIEVFTIEEEIEFRIRFSGLFFFIIPFYSSSGGAKGWIMHSRDRITSSTNDPSSRYHPSIHPKGKLVLEAMKFRFDPRFIALSLFCWKLGIRCLGEKKNIYMYICMYNSRYLSMMF